MDKGCRRVGRVDYQLNVNKEGMHLLVRCTLQESPRRLEVHRIQRNCNVQQKRKSALLAFHCICLIVSNQHGARFCGRLRTWQLLAASRNVLLRSLRVCTQDLQQTARDLREKDSHWHIIRVGSGKVKDPSSCLSRACIVLADRHLS